MKETQNELGENFNAEIRARYESLALNDLGVGVYGVDKERRCVFINASALSMLELERDEVLGTDQHRLFHYYRPDGTSYPSSKCPVFQTVEDGVSRETEETFVRKSGENFPVRLTVTPIKRDGELIGAVVSFFDITEQKTIEQYSHYLNQVYAVLVQTNQAITQCHSETSLFDQVCRIAVEVGGMDLCWISRADSKNLVRPLSLFAAEAKDGSPDISGQPQVDLNTDIWENKIGQGSWKPSVAILLLKKGQPYAVLNVYHSNEKRFNQKTIDLLNELAVNINLALDRLDLAAERAKTEAQLRLYAKVFEHSREGITITDANVSIISANQSFSLLTGYGEDEVRGQNPRILASGRHDRDFYDQMWKEINTNGHWRGEIWNRRKDGGIYAEWLSISRIVNASGEITNYIGIFGDITERKAAQDAVREAENKFRTLFERSQDAMMTIDPATGVFSSGNPAAIKLFGVSDQEEFIKLSLGQVSPEYQLDGQRSETKLKEMINIATQQGSHLFEWTHIRLDKHEFSATVLMNMMEILGEQVIQATVRDISEQKKAEEAKLEAQQLQRGIIDFLPDATFVIDSNGIVLAWNKAIEIMTGVKAQDMIGKGNYEYALPFYHKKRPVLIDLAGDFDVKCVKHYKSVTWRHGDILVGESLAPYLPRGKAILWANASVFRDSKGEVIAAIETIRDVTEQKVAEEQIQRLAYFDNLTGLPNRTLLMETANETINQARNSNEPLTLIFLDLDHFKNVNDTLGHRVGDKLLVHVAKRLKNSLRVQDTVFRLGGDEFILLVKDTDGEGAAVIAQRLLDEYTNPFNIEGHELTITPSLGIALYPADGQDFDTLYKCADIAMYFTKQGGRNSYRFFIPEMRKHSIRQLELESALRKALEREELRLYYQPQIALPGEKFIGVEALLRWQHPKFGMVSPLEFIPLAEESGLILPIGEWVLRTSVNQMKEWLKQGVPIKNMAVNLSAVQLRQKHLPELVIQLLNKAELPAEYLELELTESVAMKDPKSAVAMLDSLHDHGIRIAIDDFGTGYSSLSYLKRFRVNKLKIDQSFVRNIGGNIGDEVIIEAIISLAKSLGLRTLAEGVETEQQLAFLGERGCEEIQGYYYGKPMRPEELLKWLEVGKTS
ncbi:EAL domain-containing protein [Desulfosporosinus sp. PR]|uniref:bifunctional diguanylate cyclase/phosphodiesterase n=1 Tax=Candidatus Desulfosporosinus nitrosoreducens TaxID=3401928 RepID=UPI0027F3CD48|nr:EAL domain-containing protein [Desulfosporosinus sp. PR]MDQ7095664.1 EAL domain-containing protein [Desulfosporosinus sp. PR]